MGRKRRAEKRAEATMLRFEPAAENGLLAKLGELAGAFAERFIPDAWIYALLLTGIAFFAAVQLADFDLQAGSRSAQVARAWSKGFWDPAVLRLIAQFSINLLLCAALARTPLLRAVLRWLAQKPQSARGAISLVAAVSIVLGLVSWALCIIGGALFAQEVCRQARARGIKVHYPLAIAAGYLGMMSFGLGLTSSAPLMVASANHHLADKIGVIAFSKTVGSATSLGTLAALLLTCPLLMGAMHPRARIIELQLPELPTGQSSKKPQTFAEHLEHSWLLLKLAALLPLFYFYDSVLVAKGGALSIDAMNLFFLILAMLLFSSPRALLDELRLASQGLWSIVFQFPFYAGLMGIITHTSLGRVVAEGFVAISNSTTWPAIGVAFQGLCNLFVPSAGGQWLVTGEILVDASRELGFSDAQAVMIEVMGDQLTNMIQPMWALPALALSGLEAKDILGYTALIMIFAYFIMAAALSIAPL